MAELLDSAHDQLIAQTTGLEPFVVLEFVSEVGAVCRGGDAMTTAIEQLRVAFHLALQHLDSSTPTANGRRLSGHSTEESEDEGSRRPSPPLGAPSLTHTFDLLTHAWRLSPQVTRG